jgi:nucleoside 2-deoxyribosyltransferase
VSTSIYLAGPDVFLPDAVEVGRRKVELCAGHGLQAHYPLDAAVDGAGMSLRAHAFAIAKANEDLIRGSGIVLANLSPFRGPSVDPGTAFEIGFARSLGLKVYGYSCREAVLSARTTYYSGMDDDAHVDVHGYTIERFGLVDNLMIDGALAASGGHIVCVESDDLSAFAAFEQLVAEVAKAQR